MLLHDLRQIQDSYQHIYLSPHFDDAALSCGGAIARQRSQGQGVLVVTICSALPAPGAALNQLAQEFHAAWKLPQDEVVARRRAEDAAAMQALGADYFYLDQLDAIYRLPGYDRRERLFAGQLLPGDPLPEILVRAISTFYDRAPQATIYCPLGIGGHVDHQAAFLACQQPAQQGLPIAFYEDIPYVLVPGSGEARLALLNQALAPALVEVGSWIDTKLDSIAAYASQLDELFGGEAAMRRAVAGYAAELRPAEGVQGERLWRYSAP